MDPGVRRDDTVDVGDRGVKLTEGLVQIRSYRD
jgi:hypothetical protein